MDQLNGLGYLADCNGTDTDVNIFPYSVFYVFYEQYLTMWSATFSSLGGSVASIVVITFFLMGLDIVSTLIILLVNYNKNFEEKFLY